MRKIFVVTILWWMALPAQADSLGRLFFTPEQRRQLEHPPQPAKDTVTPPPPRVVPVTLNGVVQRDDGARSVWVNGQLLEQQVRMPQADTAQVLLPQQNKVQLQVGQTKQVKIEPHEGAK